MNGKWIWYQPGSVVCLACGPKTAGTCYTIADNDGESEDDEDASTKESAHENSGNSNDSEPEEGEQQ